MSLNAYAEDKLVEQPAIQLSVELGRETLSAPDEVLGVDGALGRETKSDRRLQLRQSQNRRDIQGIAGAVTDTDRRAIPPYSNELYKAKCTAIFEPVYQSYQGEGQSVYANSGFLMKG